MIRAPRHLQCVLLDMLYELQGSQLEVVLVPQPEPVNVGACNRAVISENPAWYQELCLRYPAGRKHRRAKFQTKVSRKRILAALALLGHGLETQSTFAQDLIDIAEDLYDDGGYGGNEDDW